MQTAQNVARWFLNRNNLFIEDEGEWISNLKLQKLLYYAQGLFLGIHNSPLFEDEFVAWKHGPVIVSVYEEYKSNANRGIEVFKSPINNFSSEEINVLQFTLDNFGQYSAWKLRNMTHEEAPWKETEHLGIIPKEKIMSYFRSHYVD